VIFDVTFDWMTLVAELGVALPGTRDKHAQICPLCSVTKAYLKANHLNNPLQHYGTVKTLADFPNAVMKSVPLTQRCYCWMHGVTRLLSNHLVGIFNMMRPHARRRGNFTRAMQTIKKSWSDKGQKSALTCNQMKRFFRSAVSTELVAAFNNYGGPDVVVSWGTEANPVVHLSYQQCAEAMFQCLCTFHDFAYSLRPDIAAFQALRTAKHGLLLLDAHFKWVPEPTTHYMLTHAVEQASSDGCAYLTLQEGMEANNKRTKKLALNTMHGTPLFTNGKNQWQLVLDRQRLRLELTHRELAPWSTIPTRYDPIGPQGRQNVRVPTLLPADV
jgi:hypothetical protein